MPEGTDRRELRPGDFARATEAKQPNPAGDPRWGPLFQSALVCPQYLAGIRPEGSMLARDPLPSLRQVH
jgi:hypothetical protein